MREKGGSVCFARDGENDFHAIFDKRLCCAVHPSPIFNTMYTMKQQDMGQQQMPGMKLMMYIMPVMFIFIFNGYSSGLNYYYFISGLIGILTMVILRKTTDEKETPCHVGSPKKKRRAKRMAANRVAD